MSGFWAILYSFFKWTYSQQQCNGCVLRSQKPYFSASSWIIHLQEAHNKKRRGPEIKLLFFWTLSKFNTLPSIWLLACSAIYCGVWEFHWHENDVLKYTYFLYFWNCLSRKQHFVLSNTPLLPTAPWFAYISDVSWFEIFIHDLKSHYLASPHKFAHCRGVPIPYNCHFFTLTQFLWE